METTVPVTAVQDYAAGCSLVQLLRLQGFLQSEVQQQGWSMEHLEASMHVVHTHSSEPLEAAATDSDTTGNSGACRAAQTEQPTLRAEAGKDSKGAQDAAERRSQERERDVSRGVPVLVLRVRGQLGMSVSFDLVSGALCIHPGESNLPGQSFCTVRYPFVADSFLSVLDEASNMSRAYHLHWRRFMAVLSDSSKAAWPVVLARIAVLELMCRFLDFFTVG